MINRWKQRRNLISASETRNQLVWKLWKLVLIDDELELFLFIYNLYYFIKSTASIIVIVIVHKSTSRVKTRKSYASRPKTLFFYFFSLILCPMYIGSQCTVQIKRKKWKQIIQTHIMPATTNCYWIGFAFFSLWVAFIVSFKVDGFLL